MCNMSKFAKFYGQLHITSLTSWIFAAVLTDCSRLLPFFPINVARRVDAFNKIAMHTHTSARTISC